MGEKLKSIGVVGFFVAIYTHGTKFFSFLGLCFGDITLKTVTCTWLNAVEFLTKEPPTGNNTGGITQCSNFRANIFCSQGRRRELTLEWNKKTPLFLQLSTLLFSFSENI